MNNNYNKIYSSLTGDEKILYVPDKNMHDFIRTIFFIITLLAVIVLIFPMKNLFIYTYNLKLFILNISLIFMQILIFLILLMLIYKAIVDFFYTEIALTNKRIIISQLNNLIFIKNNDVLNISGVHSSSRRLITLLTIKLKSKTKAYRLLFVNPFNFANQFEKVSPDYNDSASVKNQKTMCYIFVTIFFILSVFGYFFPSYFMFIFPLLIIGLISYLLLTL